MGSSPEATTLIIVQGKLLELVEKVETLETLGERGFLLQTDSPIETLSLRWEDIDWEVNRISIPEPKVKHHEGRVIRSCPIFPEQRPTVTRASEPAPVSSGCNTTMGRKNSNLRTEMTRLLRRAGVSGWPRLFHSMRASRQTELQREFPLHVVCSWLGNSPRIAQQSYLLVTEDDFAKAAGVAKVMVEV
jgi:integrase